MSEGTASGDFLRERAIEQEIIGALNEILLKYRNTTGRAITDIHVDIVDTTTFGDSAPCTTVGFVQVESVDWEEWDGTS